LRAAAIDRPLNVWTPWITKRLSILRSHSPVGVAQFISQHMSKHRQTGRDATEAEIREAEQVLLLTPSQQRRHPSAVAADQSKLSHINTYRTLPEFYLDQPFTCRKCGKREIWKAGDQKWYYEEAKGHIDARAVECHDCRTARKQANV